MTCTQTCGSATKNNSTPLLTPPAGYNWIKWNRLKKLTADKKNNYFSQEVNYSCGHQFQDILTVITFSLVTISTTRITRKKLSLSQQNYMKKDYIAMSFCLISPYIHTFCCITFHSFMHLNHHRGACHFAKQAGKKPVDLAKWKRNNIILEAKFPTRSKHSI